MLLCVVVLCEDSLENLRMKKFDNADQCYLFSARGVCGASCVAVCLFFSRVCVLCFMFMLSGVF